MISNEIMLLKLIEVNANLTPLRKRGLSQSQIALLLQKQIDLGYVESSIDRTLLTTSGKAVLTEKLALMHLKEKDSWILPQEEYYKPPLSFKTIFLPRKI